MARIMIALGGNALGNNPEEQKQLIKITAKSIVELADGKNEIIIGHGNGPQVGMIFNTFALEDSKFKMPLPESGAMSQGYIGIHLINALKTELLKNKKTEIEPIYFLTQTIVDKNDENFKKPSKPIGPFYSNLEDAKKMNPDSTIIEDSGRGFRKVVASPIPVDFIGFNEIKKAISPKTISIVCGGGGVPTVFDDNEYKIVDGVIDKDFALSKFAQKVEADYFIVLTAVDKVSINYNKPNQENIDLMNSKQAKEYIAQDYFAKGSMLPKVEAAIQFVEHRKENKAIIAKLENLKKAFEGSKGTQIKN